MRTLAELAVHFAQLDNVAPNELTTFEKGLRNLTQHNFLPPNDQVGRIFKYDVDGAAAVRLVQVANDFGIKRASLSVLTRFLFDHGTANFGQKPVSLIREAVDRAKAGESFSLSIIMGADRTYRCEVDWQKKPKSERVEQAFGSAGRECSPELARFTLPMSAIILDLLPAFED